MKNNINHEIADFQNPRESQENKRCPEHREFLKYFCHECQETCCVLCQKYDTRHHGHNIELFKE